jgi:hypothetical protein
LAVASDGAGACIISASGDTKHWAGGSVLDEPSSKIVPSTQRGVRIRSKRAELANRHRSDLLLLERTISQGVLLAVTANWRAIMAGR